MKTALKALGERAAAEGLLDVAYTNVDSPFGPLLLAQTQRGLVRLGLQIEAERIFWRSGRADLPPRA